MLKRPTKQPTLTPPTCLCAYKRSPLEGVGNWRVVKHSGAWTKLVSCSLCRQSWWTNARYAEQLLGGQVQYV